MVHHIDGNPYNNDPENLAVVPVEEHSSAPIRQVLLRLPSEVYDHTKAKAERERRSMNAHIVYVLERDTAEDDK